MAYRPLNEAGEAWQILIKKLNDAFDFIAGKISILGAKKSITQDTDGKVQLVNDLDDTELVPESVYGVAPDKTRGWIKIKSYQDFNLGDWIYTNGEYTLEFQHNLNTENVIVQVYENKKKIEVDIEIVNENKVRLTSSEKFAGKIVVEG